MKELEAEVGRFERNCAALNNYQGSLLTICRVWSDWFAQDLRTGGSSKLPLQQGEDEEEPPRENEEAEEDVDEMDVV